MCKSIWMENYKCKSYPTLKKDIKTSVAVIGGGITGLLAAYFLEKNGIECVILEASKILNGVTSNTTAKITSQHGLIYHDLINNFGLENARKYLSANEQAIENYRELSKNIECDFFDIPNYIYSTSNKDKLEREMLALTNLGFDAEYEKDIEIPIKIVGAIKFNKQAQFNPIKFLTSISRNLTIYENTKVISVDKNVIKTKEGSITADNIIVCTHYPFINKNGFYFLKLYQERSYVIALEKAQKLKGMYIDESSEGFSFRGYKDLLILGGAGARTGKECGGYDKLRKIKDELYPNATEKYCWATQDCITPDKIPYIGMYSSKKSNLFVATGFNKWGMTSSMVSAEILSDMILGRKNEFEETFSTKRSFSDKRQVYVNILETTKNFFTPTLKRCSHMGCALKYNEREDSWDCPCHGSRFDNEGKIINNPAQKSINLE